MKSPLRLFLPLLVLALGLATPSYAATTKADLLGGYASISAALAADDLGAAQAAATKLAATAGTDANKTIAAQATAVAKASSIKAARKQFVALSDTFEPLAKGEQAYVVMYCPMADASWVQPTGAVRNPYFGKAMLTCGEPKAAK